MVWGCNSKPQQAVRVHLPLPLRSRHQDSAHYSTDTKMEYKEDIYMYIILTPHDDTSNKIKTSWHYIHPLSTAASHIYITTLSNYKTFFPTRFYFLSSFLHYTDNLHNKQSHVLVNSTHSQTHILTHILLSLAKKLSEIKYFFRSYSCTLKYLDQTIPDIFIAGSRSFFSSILFSKTLNSLKITPVLATAYKKIIYNFLTLNLPKNLFENISLCWDIKKIIINYNKLKNKTVWIFFRLFV